MNSGTLMSLVPMALLSLCATASVAGADSPTPETLKQAVHGRFLIGVAVNAQMLADTTTGPLIAAQFDCLTGENAFKPISLEALQGQFTFDEADRIADFAMAHHMKLIGHNLCWHQQSPAWLYQDAAGNPLPRDMALKNLHDYIFAVVGHFKGKVFGWDVVNEALDDGPGYLRDTPALRSIGPDFVQQAFEFAHQADPKAELYYNDYNIEEPGKREKALRLVRDLKAHGVRIDAVGIQGHWQVNTPALSVIEDAIKAFQALGVKVGITELDVDPLPRQGNSADITAIETGGMNPYVNGFPDSEQQKLAQRYSDLFTLFARHSGEIERVTFWGLDDGQSWLNNFPVPGRTNYPLLFDRQDKPKPAFFAVVDALNRVSK